MIFSFIKSKKNSLFVILLLVLLLFPFIIIAFYNYYSADDYFYALNIIERGFFKAQQVCYEVVNGRYTTTCYLSFLPLAFGYDGGAFLSPLLILISLALSIYFFSKNVFYKYTIEYKLILTFIILIPFLSLLNKPSEAIYWASGAASYGISISFFFLFLGNVFRLLFIDNSKRVVFYCTISLILLIGSNETITIIVNFILLMLFVFDLVAKRKINFKLILVGIIGVLFTVIVIKSPGNLVRLEVSRKMFSYTIKENFSYNSTQILEFMRKMFSAWQANNILTFCDVLLLFLLFKFNLKINKYYKHYMWLFLPLIFVAFFVSLFPIFYTLGIQPPDRAFGVFLIFYVLTNFFIVYLTYNLLTKFIKRDNFKWINYFVFGMLLAVVFQLLTTTNNVRNAWAVLFTDELNALNTEQTNIINTVKNSKTDNCVVSNVFTRSALLYRDDLSVDDSTYFANILLATYYKKGSVKVTPFKGNILDTRNYWFENTSQEIITNTIGSEFSFSKNNASLMKNFDDYGVTINISADKLNNFKKINGLEISFKLLALDSNYAMEAHFYVNHTMPNYPIYNYQKYLKANNYIPKTWIDVKYAISINRKELFTEGKTVVFFTHNPSKSSIYIDDLKLTFME